MNSSTLSKAETITIAEAKQILLNHKTHGKGRIFSVMYKKRSEEGQKFMSCRFGVIYTPKKDENGREKPKRNYSPEQHNNLVVWSCADEAYRTISLENVIAIKVDGFHYVVDQSSVGVMAGFVNE